MERTLLSAALDFDFDFDFFQTKTAPASFNFIHHNRPVRPSQTGQPHMRDNVFWSVTTPNTSDERFAIRL